MSLLQFCQGYDNGESSVRKASVFCLVALHQIVGDDLRTHLTALSGSKVSNYHIFSLLVLIFLIITSLGT